MKFSISLSTLLLVLPAIVAASGPLDMRAIDDPSYFPGNHVRSFGRRAQQQQANAGANKQAQASAAAAAAKAKQSTAAAAAKAKQSAAAASAAAKSKGGKNTSAAAAASASASAASASSTAATSTVSAAAAAKGKGKGGKNTNSASASASASTDASASASSSAAAAAAASASAADASSSAAQASASAASNNNNDPNTSLTLLSQLVETDLAQDGQASQEPGQVASLTSTNNFINFCAGQTITNGQQITTGSCNPIPMGDVIPKANMPASKFKFPTNFSTIPANQNFTIQMNIINMQAGVFTNAQKTYYMAPQQLNSQNILIGHSHFVIQAMGAFDDPTILDPATFTFFKGIDTAAVNGVLSVTVAGGVPAGNYRLASINTDANHAPAIVAVAQHGWLDDIVYFTAK